MSGEDEHPHPPRSTFDGRSDIEAGVQMRQGLATDRRHAPMAAEVVQQSTGNVPVRESLPSNWRRAVAQTAVLAVAITLAVVAACVWTPQTLPVPSGACDVAVVHDQLATLEPRYCANQDSYYYCDCKACSLHQPCPSGKRMSGVVDCACPDGTFYRTPHWGMLAVVGLLTPVSAVCMYAGARRCFDRVFGRHRAKGVPVGGSTCDSDTGCCVTSALGATALSWYLASSFSYESPEASTYILAAATQVFGVGLLLPLIGGLIMSYWKPRPTS